MKVREISENEWKLFNVFRQIRLKEAEVKNKMEKIKIKRLGELIAFEEYIKGQQPLVACVYCSSIYFYDATGEHCQNSIQWNLKDDNSKELNKALLAAINAACNTNFELNENGSD